MLRLLVRSGHEVMGVLAHAFSGLHAKSSIDFPDVPALGALVEDCLSFVGASHLPQACVCVCVCVCVVYVFMRACVRAFSSAPWSPLRFVSAACACTARHFAATGQDRWKLGKGGGLG